MRWGTGVHMGIVQHEILDMDEFTGNPKRRRSIKEVASFPKTIVHRMAICSFIEPRQGIFR